MMLGLRPISRFLLVLAACTRTEPVQPGHGLAFRPLVPPPASTAPAAPPAVAIAPPAAPIAPPVVPAPQPAPSPAFDVDAAQFTHDPISTALAPADPDTIEIVEQARVGKDTLVLFMLALGGDDDRFAWELARVQEHGDDAAVVQARVRVWGPSLPAPFGSEPKVKLKVHDIDGDRRSEATVIVPVWRPGTALEDPGTGEIAAIFDASDLHPQLLVTRKYELYREDVFGAEEHADTTWVTKDLDHDGHADLELTSKTMAKDNVACDVDCGTLDEDVALRPRRTRTKQVCPYDAGSDRWVCPSPQLGLELLSSDQQLVDHAGVATEAVDLGAARTDDGHDRAPEIGERPVGIEHPAGRDQPAAGAGDDDG